MFNVYLSCIFAKRAWESVLFIVLVEIVFFKNIFYVLNDEKNTSAHSEKTV